MTAVEDKPGRPSREEINPDVFAGGRLKPECKKEKRASRVKVPKPSKSHGNVRAAADERELRDGCSGHYHDGVKPIEDSTLNLSCAKGDGAN